MPIERLADIQEELVDSIEAMITHTRRFGILCGKAKFPPEIRDEFNELVVDWGNNLTNFGDLLREQGALLLPSFENLKKDIERLLAELMEIE